MSEPWISCWKSLWLSLRIALCATALAALICIPLAKICARTRFRGKAVVEAFILLPLAMPPTVLGYGILVLFGSHGFLGAWLHSAFDYSIILRVEGAILAAAIVALPILYIPTKAGFAAVDPELEETAKLMGANRWQTFLYVSLPLASRGLHGGMVLGFARALGEFGATAMVFGIQPDQLTLSISIYSDYTQNDLDHARYAVAALGLLSLALVIIFNRSLARARE